MNKNVRKLAESAIMLAIGTVLGLIRLVDLPYGGAITIASMLPVIIIAYRNGFGWGLGTGLVFGVIQQLLGLKTLTFVTTWQSILAVIVLDYLFAFAAAGFGGVFRKSFRQPQALVCGAILVGIIRYICHVISGATVWAGLSIPDTASLLYSLSYNATYMIPETIILAVVAYYIGSALDFRNERITPYRKEKETGFPILRLIGGLILAAAVVFDAVLVFSKLQNPESGDFDIRGLSNVNWMLFGIVTVACVIVALILFLIRNNNEKERTAE